MNFDPFADFYIAPEPVAPRALLPEREIRRTFRHTGFCYALLVALHFGLVYGVYYLLRHFAPELAASPNAVFFYDSLPFYLIAIPLVAHLMYRLPQSTPVRQRLGAGQYFVLLCIGALFLVVGSVAGSTVSMVIEGITGKPPSAGGNDIIGQGDPWLTVLFVGICAPIAEEFIFRRVLIRSLGHLGDKVAIVVSAAVFGLIHGNFTQFFYAFALGLIFGYIYCRSGNLWLTILPHALINTTNALLGAFVLPRVLPIAEKLSAQQPTPDTMEELTSMISAELPAFSVLAVYELLLYGAAFLGFLFLCLWGNRIRLVPSQAFMTRENGSYPEPITLSCVAGSMCGNLGAVCFFALVLFQFILSFL